MVYGVEYLFLYVEVYVYIGIYYIIQLNMIVNFLIFIVLVVYFLFNFLLFLEIVCLDFFIMNIDMLYNDIFYGGFVLYICVVG